jgi:hypothetical protein
MSSPRVGCSKLHQDKLTPEMTKTAALPPRTQSKDKFQNYLATKCEQEPNRTAPGDIGF